MNTFNGYYSLIQYCPDVFRAEVANIGVLLFCPALDYMGVKMSHNNTSVKRIFGKESSSSRVTAIKHGIKDRLETERNGFTQLEDLKNFIARQANNVHITNPRTMQVTQPEETLNQLHYDLFGKTDTVHPKTDLGKIVWQRIQDNDLTNRVTKNLPSIPLPMFARTIEPFFGFKNGRFNIVQKQRLGDSGRDYSMLCRDAVEGQYLYKTRHSELGKMKLVVLGQFPSNQDPRIADAKKMLRDHDVTLVTQAEIDGFIDMIRETARPLPSELLETDSMESS